MHSLVSQAVCPGVREDSIQVEQLGESAVVRELFSSVCVEIRDEVGFPPWNLCAQNIVPVVGTQPGYLSNCR